MSSSAVSARLRTSWRRSFSESDRQAATPTVGRSDRSRPPASRGPMSSTACTRLPQPVKVTMWGPMFRYDRPQAGRYRQFWQFDVEAFGDAGPAIDAEIIELASSLHH